MRTIKVRFSGGGTLTSTFLCDSGPETWEAENVPSELKEPNWCVSPNGLSGWAGYAAEIDGQTIEEVEDDLGPVRTTYCTINGVAPLGAGQGASLEETSRQPDR